MQESDIYFCLNMFYPQERPHHNILDVFAEEKASEHGFLRVSAPMVRYSKLEFRSLLRENGVKLCFTPMIIADSFNNSQKARENEFTTTPDDHPVIAQFAACSVGEFRMASQLIYPYVDGVDLNCGCPQSWAITKGYGCGLLRQPELIHDIVKQTRRILPNDFSISVKIRLLNNECSRSTIEFARQLEHCGITFLTLHGRTSWQRSSESLNVEAMADVKQSISIPLIVNGNVKSWQDACDLYEQTDADGVMSARGLLSNPTLFNPDFKEHCGTPKECLEQWLKIAVKAGDNLYFQNFHHHLTFMWSYQMQKKLRLEFNNYSTKEQIFDFFENNYDIYSPKEAKFNSFDYIKCTYSHIELPKLNRKVIYDENELEWSSNSEGKYFKEFKSDLKDDDNDDNLAVNDIELRELLL